MADMEPPAKRPKWDAHVDSVQEKTARDWKEEGNAAFAQDKYLTSITCFRQALKLDASQVLTMARIGHEPKCKVDIVANVQANMPRFLDDDDILRILGEFEDRVANPHYHLQRHKYFQCFSLLITMEFMKD